MQNKCSNRLQRSSSKLQISLPEIFTKLADHSLFPQHKELMCCAVLPFCGEIWWCAMFFVCCNFVLNSAVFSCGEVWCCFCSILFYIVL